ncbi:MAG: ATP-binding cassette domain-containing protein [Deltaproteobacteria bacterium]|nr:ATP-binding cassette domain-containing protein [Deltaproteobacteria bacterium]
MVRFIHVARAWPDREVLVDVSLCVDSGDALVISGPGAAGKSTLVRLLLGLDTPTHGWIVVDDLVLGGSTPEVLAAHRRRIGCIAQHPLLVGDLTVEQNVALALDVSGAPTRPAQSAANEALERAGIDALRGRRAGTLSAVERRWVAVARALARPEASLLLADEPTADLDARDARRLGALLAEERAAGKTIVVTSREPSLAGLGAHRLALLDAGRITLETATQGRVRSLAGRIP